jgi:hypothetical protein
LGTASADHSGNYLSGPLSRWLGVTNWRKRRHCKTHCGDRLWNPCSGGVATMSVSVAQRARDAPPYSIVSVRVVVITPFLCIPPLRQGYAIPLHRGGPDGIVLEHGSATRGKIFDTNSARPWRCPYK